MIVTTFFLYHSIFPNYILIQAYASLSSLKIVYKCDICHVSQSKFSCETFRRLNSALPSNFQTSKSKIIVDEALPWWRKGCCVKFAHWLWKLAANCPLRSFSPTLKEDLFYPMKRLPLLSRVSNVGMSPLLLLSCNTIAVTRMPLS